MLSRNADNQRPILFKQKQMKWPAHRCEVNHRLAGNQVCLRQKVILLSILIYIFIIHL